MNLHTIKDQTPLEVEVESLLGCLHLTFLDIGTEVSDTFLSRLRLTLEDV